VRRVRSQTWAAVVIGALAAAYMIFESQWLRRQRTGLVVPDLPPELEGLTILHLSDVHAGQPGLNIHTFRKAVRWAAEVRPDLIVLTGDILGARSGWGRCLPLLRRLKAPLGVYAVPGNHEYGLSKNPLAHPPEPIPWDACGVQLLRDSCVALDLTPGAETAEPEYARTDGPADTPHALDHRDDQDAAGTRPLVSLCGADHLSGGRPLLADRSPSESDFSILLVHRPPEPDDPLGERFHLTFSGHTHGGQIRIPTPWGLRSLHNEDLPYLEGVHRWGEGILVISTGIGATFVPFRLFTRPQAVVYRLTRG
jgi:predicted MPP superfamily phosphohydrolase